MNNKIKRTSDGFTLVELLVYMAIIGFVLAIIAVFTVEIIKSNRKAEMIRETQENARLIIQRMSKEIRWANSISSFSSTDITLDTASGPVRFFLGGPDADRFFIEEKGVQRELTSDKVKVTNLAFTRMEPENAPNSIQINVTVENRIAVAKGEYIAVTSLQSSASVREN